MRTFWIVTLIIVAVAILCYAGEKTDVSKTRIVTGREAALSAARQYLMEGADSVWITTTMWSYEEGDHKVTGNWYGD